MTTDSVKPDGKLTKKIIFGGFGYEAEADREGAEYLSPAVFKYKSAYFPDPGSFDVQVKIKSAKSVRLTKPVSKLYPWGVKLTIQATGTRAEEWFRKLDGKTRLVRAE